MTTVPSTFLKSSFFVFATFPRWSGGAGKRKDFAGAKLSSNYVTISLPDGFLSLLKLISDLPSKQWHMNDISARVPQMDRANAREATCKRFEASIGWLSRIANAKW